MTVVKAVGLLLIVVGVGYPLMDSGWLRRSRRGASDGGKLTVAATEAPASQIDGPEPTATASGLQRALTLAWVEGTYINTTIASTRHERAAAAGSGGRTRAVMVVDDSTVRWEREGIGIIRVAGPRLLGVSVERGLVGKLLGRGQLVLVSWSADNGKNGDRYVTGFLPRTRADSFALVAAVKRLMEIDPSIDDSPTTPDGTS